MAVSSSPDNIWNRALNRIGQTDSVEGLEDDSIAARICRLHYDDILVEVLEAIPWSFARRQAVISDISSQSNTHAGTGAALPFDISFAFSSSSQISVTVDSVAQVAGTDYNTSVEDQRITFVVAPALNAVILITGTFARAGWENMYDTPSDMVTPEVLICTDGTRVDLVAPKYRIPFAIQAGEREGLVLLTDAEVGDEFDLLEYIAVVTHVPSFPRQFVDALAWRLAAELAPALKKQSGNSEMQRYLLAIDAARSQMLNTSNLGTNPQTPSISARFGLPRRTL